MIDLNQIKLLKAIEGAIGEDDFNEAVRFVQDAIGQTDGGTAGIFFCEFDEDEDGNILPWNKKENRYKLIVDYLLYEVKTEEFLSED